MLKIACKTTFGDIFAGVDDGELPVQDSVNDVIQKALVLKGGKCMGCACNPKFSFYNSTGRRVCAGDSISHNLTPEELGVRVICDAHNNNSRRPFKGKLCRDKQRYEQAQAARA